MSFILIILEVSYDYCLCIAQRLMRAGECFKDMHETFENTGRTALHFAAQFDIYNCIVLLHSRGQDLDKNDNDGLSPLSIAAMDQNCNSVLTLLKLNATTEKVTINVEENIVQCCNVSLR